MSQDTTINDSFNCNVTKAHQLLTIKSHTGNRHVTNSLTNVGQHLI